MSEGADLNRALFSLKNGTQVQVPSFVMPLADQIQMIESNRLLVHRVEALGIDRISRDPVSPKIDQNGQESKSLVLGIVAIKR